VAHRAGVFQTARSRRGGAGLLPRATACGDGATECV